MGVINEHDVNLQPGEERQDRGTVFDSSGADCVGFLADGDSLNKDIQPSEALGCHVLWLKGKGWTEKEDLLTHPNTITRVTQVTDWIERF